MKRIKIIYWVLPVSLIIFGLTSCKDDFLDRTPSDFLSTDEVFGQIENAESFLNGAYEFDPSWIYDRSDGSGHYTLGAASDEAIDMLDEFNYTAIDLINNTYDAVKFPLQNHWDYYYRAIRVTNIFIENFDKVPENIGDISNNRRNMLLGEAYALRAYFHFLLFQLWGPIPIIHYPVDPGSLEDMNFVRNDIEDVIDSIRIDIDRAIKFLPVQSTGGDWGRFNGIIAAKALLSRVNLYYASPLNNPDNESSRWEVAAQSSIDAIQYAENNGIIFSEGVKNGLQPYERIFLEVKNEEIIWATNKKSASSTKSYWWNEMMGSLADKGWYGEAPSQNMVDAYEMEDGTLPVVGYNADDTQIVNPDATNYDPQNPWENRDPRFYQSILYHGAEWKGRTIDVRPGGQDYLSDRARVFYFYRKLINENYNMFTGQGRVERRFPIFRLTELYLNYAEAQNESAGPDDNVYHYINKIRDRGGMPALPSGLSKDQMRERIRHERRIEMAFENQRFFDVRRWKVGEDVAGVKRSVRVDENGHITYPKWDTWIFEEKNYYLPIPQKEVDRNPKLEQNPGW